MLINRRQFVRAAAGAAVGARATGLLAQSYDVVIKGGRVLDPSLHVDAALDVAIAGGRIAAVEVNIPAGGADVIDARGRFVVPGLIDVHTHYARDLEGPALCLEDGVTAWVDAGSAGGDDIDPQVAIARAAPQQAASSSTSGAPASCPAATRWTSTSPTSTPRGTPSRGTATWWSGSRRG